MVGENIKCKYWLTFLVLLEWLMLDTNCYKLISALMPTANASIPTMKNIHSQPRATWARMICGYPPPPLY